MTQAHVLHYICSSNMKKRNKIESPEDFGSPSTSPSFTVYPDGYIPESCAIVSALYENFKGKAQEQVNYLISLSLSPPLPFLIAG